MTCSRFTCTESFQLIDDLPLEKISTVRAFNDIGLDFTGPSLLVKFSPSVRNPLKLYVRLVLVCLREACRLEIFITVHEEAFLATVVRFCDRRGSPTKIISEKARTDFSPQEQT